MPASLALRPLPPLRNVASATAIASVLLVSTVWPLTAQAQAPRISRPELEIGVRDQSVSELQGVLKLLGFYTGAISGNYSAETSQAVARFQDAAGLPMTGRVTDRTWDRLFPPSGNTLASRSGSVSGSNPATIAKPPAPILSSEPAAPAPKPATVTVPPPEQPAAAPKPAPAAKPTPTTATPEPAPNPFPILREGAEGDAVVRLQNLLRRLGVFEGVADGDFGPMTLEAVKAAQEKLGLETDGVVGPATWDALKR